MFNLPENLIENSLEDDAEDPAEHTSILQSLPGLRTALDPVQIRPILMPLLQAQLQRPVRVEHLASTIIASIAKRCVLRYTIDLDDGARVRWIGKVYRRYEGESVYHHMQALWRLSFDRRAPDRISIPEPIAFVRDLCLLLQEEIPGRTVKELLRQENDPQYMRRLARGLVKLHRCGYRPGPAMPMEDHLMRCHPKYQTLCAALPELEDDIEFIVQSALAREDICNPSDFATIHGDFHLSQMHLAGERSWLLDFDPLSFGDPAADLGNVLVILKGKSRKWGDIPRIIDVFLDEYFHVMDTRIAERIPLYEALTYLRRACKKLRYQGSGWQAETQQLIAKGVACIRAL